MLPMRLRAPCARHRNLGMCRSDIPCEGKGCMVLAAVGLRGQNLFQAVFEYG